MSTARSTSVSPIQTSPSWLIVAVALAAAVAAVPIAQAGLQWAIVSLGTICLAALLVVTRDRALVTLVVLVLSLQFLFHKSLGEVNEDIHSGADAIFINNVDVLLLVLYGLWLGSG